MPGKRRTRFANEATVEIQGNQVKYRTKRCEIKVRDKKVVNVDLIFSNLPIEYEDFKVIEKEVCRLCNYVGGITAVDCSGGGNYRRKCTISIAAWSFVDEDEEILVNKLIEYFKQYTTESIKNETTIDYDQEQQFKRSLHF